MNWDQVEGKWKLDMASIPAEGMDDPKALKMFKGMAEVAQQTAKEVDQGKYASANDAKQAMGQKILQMMGIALPPGAGIILVGDADQLPSIGPGQVLHDILRSGRVPSIRLTEIHRRERKDPQAAYAQPLIDNVNAGLAIHCDSRAHRGRCGRLAQTAHELKRLALGVEDL